MTDEEHSMPEDCAERSGKSVDSIGGCLAAFITLAFVVILAGGAISSLREDMRSRTGWTLAALSLGFVLPLVFRRKQESTPDPEQVEQRRRTARAVQWLGWIHSGFQASRAPEEIPPRPSDEVLNEKE